MPKSAMEAIQWKRINKVEQNCDRIVIEMRKLRVEFRESDSGTDHNKKKRRDEETKKMIENLKEEIIKVTNEQLEKQVEKLLTRFHTKG